jgi:hypothetical protein
MKEDLNIYAKPHEGLSGLSEPEVGGGRDGE